MSYVTKGVYISIVLERNRREKKELKEQSTLDGWLLFSCKFIQIIMRYSETTGLREMLIGLGIRLSVNVVSWYLCDFG